MRPRFALLLAVGLLLAVAPAVHAATPVTVTTLHFDTVVGPLDDTHCDVVADLYVPASAAAATPAPAILTTHGFGGSKDDDSQKTIARTFASAGYVVLSYSGLGFGGSGCKITLDDPDWDGKAGKQLVDYLATRPEVRLDRPGDPRVGMIGGSYGGQIQFAIAGIDSRLDALIPVITWNDLNYSLAPNRVHKKEWTSLFFALGIADGVTGAQYDPTRLVGCPNFTDEACLAKAELDALGYPTPATAALARRVSVASYVDRIHTPTLLVQGQADSLFNLNESARTYSALRANGVPVSMIWQSWGHSNGTAAPGEMDYLTGRYLNWFAHYLRGEKVSTGPGFAYYRDWTGTYASASSYPVGRMASLSLVTDTQTYANAPGGAPTSYSETSAVQGSLVPDPLTVPFDTPGTFAAWTSAPLEKDLFTVGVSTLDVIVDCPAAALSQASGPAGQLVLFAKLYDVAPDGSFTLHQRLVSPVRVLDVTKPIHIELPGTVQRWPAGHRIRLVLAASDAAYAGNAAVLPVTVRPNPLQPSVLRLPVAHG